MKKSLRKGVCFSLAVVMALTFPACKKKDKAESFTPSFATQFYENGDILFKFPKEWGQIADPSGAGMLVFAGKEAYEEGGFNNVTVCIYDTDAKAPALEDVETAFKTDFEAKVKAAHEDAAEFTYSNFQAGEYTVFSAEYHTSALGKEMTQTVYYPLVDNKQIYVAACDNGGEGVSAAEVAKEIVYTLRVGADEEASETE